MLKNINTALAFLLELLGVLLFAYWGFTAPFGKLMRVFMGISAPVLAILVWGFLCAPASPYRLPGTYLVVLKLAIFALAVAILIYNGRFSAGVIFGLLVIINLTASYFGGAL